MTFYCFVTYGAMMQDYQQQEKAVADILVAHESMPGNLLPILHNIQDVFGYVHHQAVKDIAEALNLSVAEVQGVISFYHYFRQTPPGKHTLRICRAESCQAMSGNALVKYAKKQLKIDWHETTRDGEFSLEPVYCLGLCACSPALSINDQVFGSVTPQSLDKILADCRGK